MTQQQFKKINKLWKLLEVALEDVERCRNDKRYKLDMGTWHRKWDTKCSVCLAGSVLTNWVKPNSHIRYDNHPTAVKCRLSAIDYIRTTGTEVALQVLHGRSYKRIKMKRKKALSKLDSFLSETINDSFTYLTSFEDYELSFSFYKWLEAELKELNE